MKFRTRAIHSGQEPCPQTGAVVPPLHLASTYQQHEAGKWREFDYSRSGNPTRKALESTVASLEGGVGALAFASGMAAIHCVTGLLRSGDHLLAGSDIYGGAYRLFHKVLDRAGVSVTLADATDLQAFEGAIQPHTKLVWVESPGNPLLSITDYAAVADMAHRHGAIMGCDNTFATPVLTRPLELGVDIVMHSATKYLGGHSDMLGGLLSTRDQQLLDELYFLQNATGAVMAPMDAFLCARGVKTLELRVREQSRTALSLAQWLASHPRVERVYFPGLASHPGHETAARQMQDGFGAMISFELAGTYAQAKKLVETTRLFHLAVSLGAVESLIEQPASMSHASYDAQDRARFGIKDGLVRLSVGLEDYEDLRDDLQEAIDSV